ncbi:MAG: hypothetical protein IRZ19_06690, partial [Pyrinomonas methylaliphatogenes]|nr:hypothetical protein [Pyrinomonas methylaliphatogenes]
MARSRDQLGGPACLLASRESEGGEIRPEMETTPNASYSLTLRVKLINRTGALGALTTAIGRAGGDIGAIDIVSVGRGVIVRDITVNASSSEHGACSLDEALT